MKLKLAAIICIVSLILCATGCQSKGEDTTVTGMVVSVDGTVISLMKTDGLNMGDLSGSRPDRGEKGEMSERPTGEGFGGRGDFTLPEGFENFDPESFSGQLPEGFESFDPKNFSGQLPEGMEIPEGMERPEGMEIPDGGSMPDFESLLGEDAETEKLDLKNARISVEIDEGKASGTIDDVTVGSFVTVTLNAKGEATAVLVSSSGGKGGFGGMSGMPNFGGNMPEGFDGNMPEGFGGRFNKGFGADGSSEESNA